MDESRKPVRFRELLRTLVDAEVEFVVVGGVAAVLEGAPISTFDLDVVYSVDEENLSRLGSVLRDLHATYVDPAGRSLEPTTERLGQGGHHLLRTDLGRLDLLASVGSGLTFDRLVEETRTHRIHGMAIRVLRLETLIATKESADRAKDRAVLDLLRSTLAERKGQED